MSRQQFTEIVRAGLVALPQQLKAVLRLMDDPTVPDECRAVAAGAVLHVLNGSNTIPGLRGGVLSYVDDVLVLKLACGRIGTSAPDAMAQHRTDLPELFGRLDEEVTVIREHLGPGIAVLDKVVERLAQQKHHGRSAVQCVADEEAGTMLYDEVTAVLVDIDLEEEAVARALKQLDPVLDGLRQQR